MVSGLKILLQGSLFGNFISYVTKGRVLPHQDYLEITKECNSERERKQMERRGSKNSSDAIIVEFKGDDDPELPKNWPSWVKIFVASHVGILVCFLYIAAVIYFPSAQYLIEEFDINETASILPLTLYVIAYGLGPMLFSPLSEHPAIGRNLTYVIPLLLFVVLQIPTALVHNFAGLCVLRFISGILISPVLGTGGGTFVDLFEGPYLPIAMCIWGFGGFSGSAFGPLFGQAVKVDTNGWRWDIWILLIISGCLSISFVFFIPETNSKTILYRKANRLRRLTENETSTGDDSHLFTRAIVMETLWRPVVIGTTEPVVIMINLYVGVVYAIIYLWFECLPIIFELHNFSSVAIGCTYLGLIIGCAFGSLIYCCLIYRNLSIPLIKGETVVPEVFAPISLIGAILLPIGILITGWTAAIDIHWIAPLIGVVVLGSSSLILFQTLLNYIAMSFPRYVASAFASNVFARSVLAGCFPLFGRAMFLNLKTERFPVAWGCTILAGISLVLLSFSIIFNFYGAKLRASSYYAGY